MNTSSEKDKTTKENILYATIELIKAEGLEKVTLRKIAAAGDVNLALINYYFGSKDKLVNEAIKVMLASFREAFCILDDQSKAPKERLKTFLVQYTNSVKKYPELMKELLGKGNISFESQVEYTNFMKTMGLNKIKATLKEITGENDSNILTMMMMQIFGATFLPTVLSCKKHTSIVWNPIPIEEQIDFFFEHYLSKYS
ncbi:TetR/AcrR family transcriptional regulator [Niallia sp. 03190]|uniref:TetR/AcrR family transcriptional regulator n=1 Tax=Niallia sp. 03190 TaxID=3458061 RepID=UPI004044FB61